MSNGQHAQGLTQDPKASRQRDAPAQARLQVGAPGPGDHYWVQQTKTAMDIGLPRLKYVGGVLSALRPGPDGHEWKGRQEMFDAGSRLGLDESGMLLALKWLRGRSYVRTHQVSGELYYKLTEGGRYAYYRLVKRSESL
jgi:hypothetical protein